MSARASDASILAGLGLALQRSPDGVAQPVSLQPWQYIRRDGLVGVCAWCQKERGVTPSPGESHGICPGHAELHMAQLRRAA